MTWKITSVDTELSSRRVVLSYYRYCTAVQLYSCTVCTAVQYTVQLYVLLIVLEYSCTYAVCKFRSTKYSCTTTYYKGAAHEKQRAAHEHKRPDLGWYVELESRVAQDGGGGTGADEAHDLPARSRPPLAWVAGRVPWIPQLTGVNHESSIQLGPTMVQPLVHPQ